ncbi:MAG: hypothetical protein OEP48_04460 [Betaproteobacteria bacterium]|nr:hypothetical protein [Betaproteobacteria bacterium]
MLDNAGPLSVHTGGTEMLLPKDFRWPGGKRIGVFLRMAFEKVIEIAKKSKDVWIGTRAEGAAHVRKALKNS